MKPTLSRAVDRAIARENAAVIRTLCQKCMGTGTLYPPPAWERVTCDRCKGTGNR